MRQSLLGLALACGSLGSASASAQDDLLALMQDDTQWVAPRKDYSNQGYSGLS